MRTHCRHCTCRSRSSTGCETFSTAKQRLNRALCGVSVIIIIIIIITFSLTSIFDSNIFNMKADHTLSAIFRQLRPALRQPRPAYLHPRPLSQLAPLRHPSFLRPSDTPKRGITKFPFPPHSLQTRRISGPASAPSSAVSVSPDYPSDTQITPEKQPAYELTFTCKPCKHRSTHSITKHGYHKGTVLITCPECSNRHLISDHLKVGFQPLPAGCGIGDIGADGHPLMMTIDFQRPIYYHRGSYEAEGPASEERDFRRE